MGAQRRALEGVVVMAAVVVPNRLPDVAFWRRKRVLVTGHTGFKGAWLASWLAGMEAEVHGYSLSPPTQPNLFELGHVADILASDTRGDVRDVDAVVECMGRCKPEIVLHLAAQSLVRPSYAEPLATFAVNVMGTAHVLEASRHMGGVRAVVIVTTDKCYENREWPYPYRENDPLGGHDPYSASKAAAEIATACWRASFAATCGIRIASARAGNVIGAGDFAPDRLLPDCCRAFALGQPVTLRQPHAVRPWQHVLEPLTGYLLLAEHLCGERGNDYARAWNFGPDPLGDATVGEVAAMAARLWGSEAVVEVVPDSSPLHEAGLLRLDSTLARGELGWVPRWKLGQAVAAAVAGYRSHAAGGDLAEVVRCQIADYCAAPAPGH